MIQCRSGNHLEWHSFYRKDLSMSRESQASGATDPLTLSRGEREILYKTTAYRPGPLLKFIGWTALVFFALMTAGYLYVVFFYGP